MFGLIHVAAAVSSGLLVILVASILWRRCCCRERKALAAAINGGGAHQSSLQDGISRLHQIDIDSKRRGNYYVFRRGVSTKPLFNWADHPSLVTDAVENGWSRFAFAGGTMSSPSTKSALLGMCTAGDYGRVTEAEISWEVCQGSADFMQKIRMNSGLKKLNATTSSTTAAAAVVRTALPLPGPPLGDSSFPQEAYFEITILYSRGGGHELEGEKTKLIRENSNSKANSESLVHVSSNGGYGDKKIEEMKFGSRDGGRGEVVMVSVGMTGGGSLPMKLPGSYPGSVGFNSNGSVHLDGIKLVYESEKADWGRTDKVIGCGFDPKQKEVFFTVDSELVHVIHCKSEEFGTPLYPTLAANSDIMVLVNFGQSVFKYGPANAQRTPNPCFTGPPVNSPAAALGYDSRELFSMGRIDSQWLNRSTTRGSHGQFNGNTNRAVDFDEESDADLFEIVLDSSGRSPNTVL